MVPVPLMLMLLLLLPVIVPVLLPPPLRYFCGTAAATDAELGGEKMAQSGKRCLGLRY
jgi:hypothetical protein